MKRFLPLLVVATGLLAAQPAAAATKPFTGVVLSKQQGLLLVAGPRGFVRAIRGRASVGSRLSVSAGHVRVVGHARRALVRGVVVRRTGSVTFLSASSRLLAVKSGRRLASVAAADPLQPGTVVQSEVAVAPTGGLTALQTQPVGTAGNVQVTATVAAVAAGSVTLTVNGQSLTIPLPAGLTLPATLVGTQVTLNVSFAGGRPSAAPDDENDDDEADENDEDDGNQGNQEDEDDHGGDDD